MKKINKILTTALACGVLGGSFAAATLAPRASSEVKAASYQTYVPLRDGWIENTDGSEVTDLNNAIRARNDRFWSGNADPNNWDSQERSFNALDEFVDTIHKAAGGEGWRGAYRTPELTLVDNSHRYISFLFGGGEGDIFINIFQVTGEAGSGDRITGIKTAFDGRGSFDDKEAKLNAPISCNMVFKYFELPNEIQPGDRFLIYVRDGKTGGYGGFTFGSVQINQTLEEVAKSFSAHKAQMKLNEYMSDWTRNANEFVLNYYATDDFYATVRTAEAALVDANDDFETNDRLSKWAYDQDNSRFENGDLANINFNGIYSDKEWKWGQYFYDNDGLMPINKTGNLFLTGEPNDIGDGMNCGLPESAKYRLVSPEFTLSGTGLISAKLGGHYARLSLLDANYNVLATTADGDGNNPAFKDDNMTNIFTSGARMCTMTRFYLDCSKYLNQRVHIAIEDSKVGGGWGLAFFDEIVTKYNSLPSFVLDSLRQTHPNSEHVDYGVIMSKLVLASSEENEFIPEFKEAFDFVEEYFRVARNSSSNYSWCSVSKSDLGTLEDDYDGLSDEAKALVDSSEDYYYVNSQVSKVYNIGQSMSAIETGVYPVPNGIGFLSPLRLDGSSYAIIIIVSFSVILTFLLFFVVKKHKNQK